MKANRNAIKETWEDYIETRIPGVTDYRDAVDKSSREGVVAKELELEVDDVRRLRAKLEAIEGLNDSLKELYVWFDDDANLIVDEVVKRHRTETWVARRKSDDADRDE